MKFSVIIPLYNKKDCIENTIRSVIKQSYTDYELIIINDGSTDGSEKVVEEMLLCDNYCMNLQQRGRLKFINRTNHGVSATRNYGISVSKGQYICFLDADDWWEKDFLRCINNMSEIYPDKALLATNYFIYKNKQRHVVDIGLEDSDKNFEIDYTAFLLRGYHPIQTGSVVINRIFVPDNYECFKEQYKFGEDFQCYFFFYMLGGLVMCNDRQVCINQDVDLYERAASPYKLYRMEENVFFNLSFSSFNSDFAIVILEERLMLLAFERYFLKGVYLDEIRNKLKDIHWEQHPHKYYIIYCVVPRRIQLLWWEIRVFVSRIKKQIIRWVKK